MNNKKIISAIAILLAVLMLIGLVVSMLPASVYADGEEDFSVNTQGSLEELQARKEELAAKAEQSKNTIAELESGQAALIEQKAAYDERDSYLREQIALPMFIAYMAIGVFIGVFGGVNAIRNYLDV